MKLGMTIKDGAVLDLIKYAEYYNYDINTKN